MLTLALMRKRFTVTTMAKTTERLYAVSSWLQSGLTCSSVSEAWQAECEALAVAVGREVNVLVQACLDATRREETSPARLLAIVSLFTSCAQVPMDAETLARVIGNRSNVTEETLGKSLCSLFVNVGNWLVCYMNLNTSTAVATALLHSQVLHGCSRKLALALSEVATLSQSEGLPAQPAHVQSPASTAAALLLELLAVSNAMTAMLALQATRSSPAPPRQEAEGRATAAGAVGRGDSSGASAAAAAGRQDDGEDTEDEEELITAAPPLVLALMDGLAASSALEQQARALLALAGRQQLLVAHLAQVCARELEGARDLQAVHQAVRQATEQLNALAGRLYGCAVTACDAYNQVSRVAYCPGLCGYLPSPTAPDRRRTAGSSFPSRALHDIRTQRSAPMCVMPRTLDPTRAEALRRVLSGPCARHLALCLGLRTLSALDGGTTYGMPDGAGVGTLLLRDHSAAGHGQQLQQREREGPPPLSVTPLSNLLAVLAVSPYHLAGGGQGGQDGECGEGGEDAEAGAGRPGRATRLQLTLRVARVAAAAGAGAGAGAAAGAAGAGPSSGIRAGSASAVAANPQSYSLAPDGYTFEVAVGALQFAWRHMPPLQPHGGGSRGGRGNGRRRAALRQWAAAVADLACGGLLGRAPNVRVQGERLGLLVALHPHVVGPMAREGTGA